MDKLDKILSSCLCDDVVFKSVFELNFKQLRNFLVYKFRSDIESAEDQAQNAFVKLWENCGTLKPDQAKSFLYTIAIRLSLNNIKHNQVVNNFEIQFKTKSPKTESPEFLMEESELKTQLEQAINNLPEKQRTVFLMNRFDSQSYTEIAASLDLSVKAVEKRMHQALVALRKVIKNV
jgi:RNA polymerase sigma-70 factor (family 1)